MLRRGAVVVDIGINVVDGRIVGDVDFEAARQVASAITPVPGGVGPLTNALLLAHLVRAARGQEAAPQGDATIAVDPPLHSPDRAPAISQGVR
jgi:methylenetetrahydrofolate dehydrogenase (NADP+)/methenyltetrahydrofolate cyclohydrolase